MILNSLAVLDGSVAFLRLIAGSLVVGLGIVSWRTSLQIEPAKRKALERDRYYFLSLISLLLLRDERTFPGLCFTYSFKAMFPEWPGTCMCIYGVSQIRQGK